MGTNDMNPSSPMDKLELISIDLIFYVVIISPSLTELYQEGFPIVAG
jgi:hypothetical protein